VLKYDFSYAFKETLESGLTFDELIAIGKDVPQTIEKILSQKPGFLRILNDDSILHEVKSFSGWLENFDNFVVIGIGGSALGNQALHSSLRPLNWNSYSRSERGNKSRFFVLDNVDPDMVASLLDELDLKRTVFNIISKSGTTAECMSNYLIVRNLVERLDLPVNEHFVFTTDRSKGVLRDIAAKENIKTLDVPDDVGGRFSVLTAVGLLSALAEGIDIDGLYEGARFGKERYLREDVKSNPATVNALIHHWYMKKNHNISVMMPYSNRLYTMADWYRQLWAESLGKKFDLSGRIVRVGQTPVKALGAIDQHSQVQLYNEGPKDKVITFLKVENFSTQLTIPFVHTDIEALSYLNGIELSELLNAELKGTAVALAANGVPNVTITFPQLDEFHIGEFIISYEIQTAIMGQLLRIDPYDQPGVELGKKLTYAFMARRGYEELRERYEEKTSWRFEL
jgi:glucose-6-phosphate isomerase